MKQAVGYVRVSTEDQAAEGVSLKAQRTRIAAYCAANDLDLVRVHEDAGLSGKNLDRPGLTALLEEVRSRSVEAVVFSSLDRLSRSVRDLLSLVEDDFKGAGVEIHSLRERIDTSTAVGRFFLTVMGALAEMERGLIGERTAAALAQVRASGTDLGTTPYGFRREGRRLVPLEGPELETARRIVDLRDRRRLGYREIADLLNAEGVPPRRGARWYSSSVRSVYLSFTARRTVVA